MGICLSFKQVEQRVADYCEKWDAVYLGDLDTDYQRYCEASNPISSIKFSFDCADIEHEPYTQVIGRFDHGCAKCGRERTTKSHRLSQVDLNNFLAKRHLKLVSPYSDYVNQNSHIEVSRMDTGLRYWTKYATIKSARTILGCKSIIEAAIKQVLAAAFPNHRFVTTRPTYMRDLTSGSNLEIDCFCASLNNCGIEIDGIQHDEFTPGLHKNEKEFQAQQNRDAESDKLFLKEHGSRLVRLKEKVYNFNVLEILKEPDNAKLTQAFIQRVYNALKAELPATTAAKMTSFERIAVQLKGLGNKLISSTPAIDTAKALCIEKNWTFVRLKPATGYVKDNFLAEVICDNGHLTSKTIGNLRLHGCVDCQSIANADRCRLSPGSIRKSFKQCGCTLDSGEEFLYKNNQSYLWFTFDNCGHRKKDSLGHVQELRECVECNKLTFLNIKAIEVIRDYASLGRTITPQTVIDFKIANPNSNNWNSLYFPHVIDQCGHESHERLSRLKADPMWRICRVCEARAKFKTVGVSISDEQINIYLQHSKNKVKAVCVVSGKPVFKTLYNLKRSGCGCGCGS